MSNTITTKFKKVTFWVVFLQVLLIGTVGLAQQTNNWYFGSAGGFPNTGIRIDFTGGTPQVSTCNPIRTEEGSSSISDATGKPLFYTDGLTIWDASTNTSFGTGLLGGSSATQSAIVMPKPGATNQWLVFTSGATGTNGINYYTVTGSPGAFTISGSTNLAAAGTVCEGLFVIGSTNAAYSFWVIARAGNNNNGRVLAWPVSTAGVVTTTAVTSNLSGPGFTNILTDQLIGTIKSNSCQTMLAFTYFNGDADIVSFDATTGMVKNDAQNIPIAGGQSYGIEFSPNDQYLYLTSLGGNTVYRYTVTLSAGALTTGALSPLTTTTGEAGQLQLGPNGVIYMANRGNGGRYLSSITNPNTGGSFTANAIDLQTVSCGGNAGFVYRGLPTFPKALTITNPVISPRDTTVCRNTTVNFKYLYAGYVSSIQWRFFDDNSTSSSATPSHTFTTNGTWKVLLSITDACARVWKDSINVTIVDAKVPAGMITCGTNSLTLTGTGTPASDYPNYVWYSAATGGNILGIGSPVTLNYASAGAMPTSVWVEVAGSASVASSGSNSIGPTVSSLTYSGGNTSSTTAISVLASSVTLNSFQVTLRDGASYGGTSTVTIRNAANVVVFTQNYTLAGASPSPTYTLNLGTTLGTGNYTIAITGTPQYMMNSSYSVPVTNAGQISIGTSTPYIGLANLQYTYSNYTIVPTCTQRVKVDRHCLTITPGDGTYCMNTNITLGYALEGATSPTQTWAITPGTLGTDWTYTTGSSTSAAPVVQFLTAGTYTVTVTVIDAGITYTKSETFIITAASTPAGAISCDPSTNSLTFNATGTPASEYPRYVWYSAASGGTVLGTGTPVTKSYATPSAAPASVWVEVATSVTIGASGSNSIGPTVAGLSWSGGGFTTSQTLNVIASSVTLNSFQVKLRDGASYGGTVTVAIRDASNAVVFTQLYNIPGAAVGPTYTLNLNTTLAAGSYTLTITPSASVNWMAFSGWPGATNAGELSLGSANSVLANLQYSYSNTTIVPSSCPVRVKVDRNCSLPVTLLSFTGTNEGTKNILNWITGTEINNDYFEVQRSSDGINFVTIGIVKGHGNSTTINEYQFTDYTPASGVNYYRYVQHDYDNNIAYSPVIKLTVHSASSTFSVSPNPSTESFNVYFTDATGGEFSVLDVLGQTLVTKTIESGIEKIEVGSDLARGAYILRYSGAGGVSTQLVIKE